MESGTYLLLLFHLYRRVCLFCQYFSIMPTNYCIHEWKIPLSLFYLFYLTSQGSGTGSLGFVWKKPFRFVPFYFLPQIAPIIIPRMLAACCLPVKSLKHRCRETRTRTVVVFSVVALYGLNVHIQNFSVVVACCCSTLLLFQDSQHFVLWGLKARVCVKYWQIVLFYFHVCYLMDRMGQNIS